MPEAAASLFLSLLLFSAVHVVSVLGVPLALLAPAPLAILCVRRGTPALAGCVTLGCVALGSVAGPQGAAAFLFVVGAPAFLIAHGLVRAWAPEAVVGAAAGVVAAATLVALQLLMPDGIRPWVGRMVDQTIDLYARQGGPEPMAQALAAQADRVATLLFHMLPLATAASGILLAASSLLLARAYFARRPVPGVRPFAPLSWYLPDPWIWALIAAGVLLLVPHDMARIAGGNALGILTLAYAFQGWAVTAYIFKAKAVHPAIQAAFYLLMLLWPVLALFLVLTGILDVWTDLRKVRPQEEPAPD